MDLDKQIVITDEETGKEKKMDILFTYENKETHVQYVFFYDGKKPDDIFVMRYNDEGNLFEIESDEEYDELDKVLDAFSKEQEEKSK